MAKARERTPTLALSRLSPMALGGPLDPTHRYLRADAAYLAYINLVHFMHDNNGPVAGGTSGALQTEVQMMLPTKYN